MADLGTRKGAKLDDISIKSVNDLKLCNEEKQILDDDGLVTDNDCISNYVMRKGKP